MRLYRDFKSGEWALLSVLWDSPNTFGELHSTSRPQMTWSRRHLLNRFSCDPDPNKCRSLSFVHGIRFPKTFCQLRWRRFNSGPRNVPVPAEGLLCVSGSAFRELEIHSFHVGTFSPGILWKSSQFLLRRVPRLSVEEDRDIEGVIFRRRNIGDIYEPMATLYEAS